MPTSPAFRPPIEETPPHLRIYLSHQDYSLYTPIDQASWRFIMKVGQAYFAEHAHRKYLDGLRETGITLERIPRIEEMDEKLRRFGWRAVPVIGFIPPAAFLEFQSHGLLPIACDMRKIENLNYTPAPDIVHEAAGHAPIIADPSFAAYLRSYGEVSRRAIFSRENMDVYFAVRRLSDTKERPDATPEEVAAADRNLQEALAAVTYDSEVDWVTRLGWWTTEYGLVGDLADPKIYGAGLLSSIGESFHCLSDRVRKIPLSIDCIHTPFNITEPQPQLFVTPSFEFLGTVLEELASRMAYRRGGVAGLEVARRGGTVCTVEFDSGLQVSGIVGEFGCDASAARENSGADDSSLRFIRFLGPTQFALADQALEGVGPAEYPDGCLMIFGALSEVGGEGGACSAEALEACGFREGCRGRLDSPRTPAVEGSLLRRVERGGRVLCCELGDSRVAYPDGRGPEPPGGRVMLACIARIRSVFGGAADRFAFLQATDGARYEPGSHKTNVTDANRRLNELYARVRRVREEVADGDATAELSAVAAELQRSYPRDWLLRWELLELDRIRGLKAPWGAAVHAELLQTRNSGGGVAESVDRGLQLLAAAGGASRPSDVPA